MLSHRSGCEIVSRPQDIRQGMRGSLNAKWFGARISCAIRFERGCRRSHRDRAFAKIGSAQPDVDERRLALRSELAGLLKYLPSQLRVIERQTRRAEAFGHPMVVGLCQHNADVVAQNLHLLARDLTPAA